MAGWQYRVSTVVEESDEEVQIFLEQIGNARGQQWELVTLRALDGGRVRYYFKRPLPTAS